MGSRLTQRIRKEEKIRQQNLKKRKKKEREIKSITSKYNVDDLLVRGIYFLYKDNQIVYIGYSKKDVMSRICRHNDINDKYFKDFDSFSVKSYEHYSDRQLKNLESILIKRYHPKHNISENKNKASKIFLKLKTIMLFF